MEFRIISLRLPKVSTDNFKNPNRRSDENQNLTAYTNFTPQKPRPLLLKSSTSRSLILIAAGLPARTWKRGCRNNRVPYPIMSIQSSQGKRAETLVEGTCNPLECFQKAWYDCFLDHHDLTGKDDVPAVDTKKSWGGMEDDLEIFLQTSGNLGSPCEADEVKRYCKAGADLEAVRQGLGESGTKLIAWVDDRNSPDLTGEGSVRLGGTWLSAPRLLSHLRQPVRPFPMAQKTKC